MNRTKDSRTLRIAMENRRQHYRQGFASVQRLRVTLTTPDGLTSVNGEIANMSIGGLCIESAKLQEHDQPRWLAVFTLEGDTEPTRIQVERVPGPRRTNCTGFRFLPAAKLQLREEQERAIWKYLLEVQRSERQRLKEANKRAG